MRHVSKDPAVRPGRPVPIAHRPTFQDFLEYVYAQRLTGKVTLHVHRGIPRFADLDDGERITLRVVS